MEPHRHSARWLGLAFVLVACGPASNRGNPDGGGDASSFPDCDPAGGNTCRGNDVVTCTSDGTFGTVVETCMGTQTCQYGSCQDACTAQGVDLIYVLDDQEHVRSFDPTLLAHGTGAFADLGMLHCPHSSFPIDGSDSDVTPMSMSVDRDGNAWVLYTSGEIFKAPIQHLDQCAQTHYAPGQAGMDLFGMGFVSDTMGSSAEHLYIGGGDVTSSPGGNLAVIDPTGMPPHATRLGNLTQDTEHSPELTGTGGAQLWGFYPGIDLAYVQQIDRSNGSPVGARLSIPNGLGGEGATPSVLAWAFAQWGGTFYIFATTTPGDPFPPDSTLRIIDQNGAYHLAIDELPWKIVGAGVSTCAPFVIE